MKMRIVLAVVAALAVFAAIFGYKYHKLQQARAAMAARKPAPASVTSAIATKEQWQRTLDAVGSLQSHQGITVRSEIEGRIVKVAFDSGARVKAGDVLVETDTASEDALLAGYEASSRLAELNLERARELQKNSSNTRADVDTAEATAAQARANIAETRATLAKKRIVAPFDGRLGLRLVNVGQFLNKGDAVVTLEAIDPIYADFTLPQQDVTNLKVGLPVRVSIDAFPDRTFEGSVEAVDPRVDADTRSLRVRAIVPNKDEILRPGMFARVSVLLPDRLDVIVVPATSIVYSPYGNSVYVVARKSGEPAAEQRFITVGPKRGDQASLLSGVKPGEEVVTAGQTKLRPGVSVKVDNSVTPSNEANPNPPES